MTQIMRYETPAIEILGAGLRKEKGSPSLTGTFGDCPKPKSGGGDRFRRLRGTVTPLLSSSPDPIEKWVVILRLPGALRFIPQLLVTLK